mgnify:CR=1 FL=1
MQGLNIVRVISLFYLGQWNMQVFEWAHLYVWQALIMLDVLVVWLVWVAPAAAVTAGSGRPGGPPDGSPRRCRLDPAGRGGRLTAWSARPVSSPGSSRGCR